jgi:RNA polymerase sigma-70 factor, ECF subfamily
MTDTIDFGVVAQHHVTALLATAEKLCGNRHDACDLVQDTLERAMTRVHTLAPGTSPRAWMQTILHNLFIDRCRSDQRRGPTVDIDDVSVPAPEPTAEPAWADLGAAELHAAIARLDDDFRAVYEMHALGRQSYRAIADLLGIPTATVGTRLVRARQKLKALLVAGVG